LMTRANVSFDGKVGNINWKKNSMLKLIVTFLKRLGNVGTAGYFQVIMYYKRWIFSVRCSAMHHESNQEIIN
jgi:hypothetical protein